MSEVLEKAKKNKAPASKQTALPVLPLRDVVVYPKMIMPIFVGRDKSIEAVQKANDKGSDIILVMQKKAETEVPTAKDLYKVGTLGNILQMLKLPDGTVKILVEGVERIKITAFHDNKSYFSAETESYPQQKEDKNELESWARAVVSQFEDYVRANKKIPFDVVQSVKQIDDYAKLADTVASHLTLKTADKQFLLEASTLKERLNKLLQLIDTEMVVWEVEDRIKNRVKKQMEKSQKEYYLNEQMKAIQKELRQDEEDELGEYLKRINTTKFTKEAREKALNELKKLRAMSSSAPESSVIHNYLDWLLDLPWDKKTKLNKDLNTAIKILDEDHYGLEKVKERIVEYLAVQSRSKRLKAPILCLVGPPGVGKTSLGRSIARATNRHFVRASLGGMRDEAEIRGHRRTYIGAMPGRFIQALRRAKCMNPVLLLDEIDKMAADFRGDPASALLEVLDPEQNHDFTDHFMEVGLDLSRVLFIATANSEAEIPDALRDRLEVVRLPGYYAHEKRQIASKFLIPKICERCGVGLDKDISISDAIIEKIIKEWTREAGVRELERSLESVVRHRAKEIVMGKKLKRELTEKQLQEYLGVPRFTENRLPAPGHHGVITGLAWTSVGGEILTLECMLLSGKGHLMLTGKLDDVMKESAQIALSLVRERLHRFGIDPAIVKKTDIHIHVPEGAVPKDGPSAGIAITLALLSAFTRRPVAPDIAFTGEVSLTGDLLPIGGLNEKALAAQEAGVKTLYLPEGNKKDVVELPAPAKKGLKIHPKKHIDEIIKELFPKPKK